MRTLPAVLPDVIDELTHAVPDYIPATEEGNCRHHYITEFCAELIVSSQTGSQCRL